MTVGKLAEALTDEVIIVRTGRVNMQFMSKDDIPYCVEHLHISHADILFGLYADCSTIPEYEA